MGTIEDKLNYTIAAKKSIQEGLIYQNVGVPDNAPFGEYGDYIMMLSGGGGFSNTYTFALIADMEFVYTLHFSVLVTRNGARALKVFVDDLADFMEVAIDVPASDNAYVSFSVKTPVLPVGKHVVTCTIADSSMYVSEMLFSSFDITPYINTIEGMTNRNYSSDDGSQTFTVDTSQIAWPYDRGNISSIVVSGNSFLGLNGSSESIRVNHRDNYISTYYVQYIDSSVRMFKLRWKGWSPYGSRSDPYLYEWEIFFIENGDVFINLAHKGASTTWSGAFSMLGATFTLSSDKPYASFYRQDIEGLSWLVENELYDISKNTSSSDPIVWSDNICDMVPHGGYYTGDTTFYAPHTSEAVYSYVVPITPGKHYKIENAVTGNRLRIHTADFDPTTITTNATCKRALYDSTAPVSGFTLEFMAASDETFLNLYYTNQGDSGVIINVYESL